MIQKIKQLSLKQKLAVLFGAMLLVVLCSYSIVFWQSMELRKDAGAIELSRSNERLLRETTFYATLILNEELEAKRELRKNIEQYSHNLNYLDKGGVVQIQTERIRIIPLEGAERVILDKIKKQWERYHDELSVLLEKQVVLDTVVNEQQMKMPNEVFEDFEEVQTIVLETVAPKVQKKLNPEVERAFQNIIEQYPALQESHHQLTELLVQDYIKRQFLIRLAMVLGALGLLALCVIGYIYFTRAFTKPVEAFSRTAAELAQGNVEKKVLYEAPDELGKLAEHLNALTNSLRETTRFTEQLRKRNFNSDFSPRSPKDALGKSLVELREQLRRLAEEEQRRQWANEGFAQLIGILREYTNDSEELAYQVIASLVKYLGAEQGGLFVLEEDQAGNRYLELKAGFAYNQRKYLQKRLELGQSLVGQAVLEKDTLHLDKLPEDYLEISSGLGEATPQNLLIVPLIDHEETYGAIEIASFKKLEEHEVEFVQKVAENVASTIATIKRTARMNKLLEESREATEQMRKQEQIMRKSLEKLAQTQEEMERNKQELERMKENLERQVRQRTMELQEKEAQLSEALRLANLAPWKLDIEQEMIIANEHLYNLLKTNREVENGYQLPTTRFLNKFVVEEDRKLVSDTLAEAIKTQDVNYEGFAEFRIRQSDGEIRYVTLSIKKEMDINRGKVRFLYGTIQDITRQKRIEDRIRQQNEELERQKAEQEKFVAIIDNTTDLILMTDLQYHITYSNKISEKQYGIAPSKGARLQDLFEKAEWKRFTQQAIPQALEKGFWEGELEIISQRTFLPVYCIGNVIAVRDTRNEIVALALILRDITEKQKIEKERELESARMRAILESTEDEIVAVDEQFRIISFNTRWAEFMKRETGSMPAIGQHIFNDFEYKRSELKVQLEEDFKRALAKGAFSIIDTYKETKEVGLSKKKKQTEIIEHEYYYLRFYNPMYDKSGQLTGIVCFTKNITEQKLAETAIQKSEQRLKAISEATTEGIIIHEKGFIKDVNSAFCRIIGYSEKELIGQYFFDYLDPESKALAIINMQLGYAKPFEAILINKAGEGIPIEIHNKVHDYAGQRIRIFSVRDISTQKEVQEELRKSKDTLQKIIDTLPHSVFWKDRNSIYLGCNQRFLQIIGAKSIDDIIGKTDYDLWDEHEAEFYIASDQKVMETGIPEIDVLQSIVQADGKQLWLRVSKIPFTDSEGNIIGIIGTYQDITEQKENEEAIIESKERLRQQIEILTTLGAQRVDEEGLRSFAQEVTKAVAHTVNVARVSVWEYQDGQLKCVDLYDKTVDRHTSGKILLEDKAPKFFKTLKEEPVIVAEYAQVDPRTKELTMEYLAAASITSLLCYPIRIGNRLKGMIACEHVRTPREWHIEEQSFVTSMMDLLSLRMEEIERQQIEKAMRAVLRLTEQLIEQRTLPIATLDLDGCLLNFNKGFRQEIESIYAVGIEKRTSLLNAIPIEADRKAVEGILDEVMKERRSIFRKITLGRKHVDVIVNVEPIIDENDDILGFAFSFRQEPQN